MNPLIPMGFNSPDPVAAYAGGAEVKGRMDDRANQNALRSYIQQNGAGIMSGDQNALAGLGGIGPQGLEMAMGVQNQKLNQEATRQGMAIDRERLGMARQQAALQAAQAARQMGAQEAAQAAAELKRIGGAATVAYRGGRETFGQFMTEYADVIPEEFQGINYDNAPYAIAMVTGMTEGFQQEALKPTSGMQEYDFARRQGYEGTFEEWKAGQSPRTEIINNMGEAARTGTIPPGYAAVDDPTNPAGVRFEPIPGGPVEAERAAKDRTRETALENTRRSGDVVIEDIARAKKLIEDAPWYSPAVGMGAETLSKIPGTGASDLKFLTDTVKANVGFDRLQQMRDASTTGGALGAINQTEMLLLQSALGSLEQSQSESQFVRNLERLNEIYMNIVNVGYTPDGRLNSAGDNQISPSPQPSREPITIDGYTIRALD